MVFEKKVIKNVFTQRRLFKAVLRSKAQNVMNLPETMTDNFRPEGCLPIGETKRDKWKIGLRETMEAALEREMYWNKNTNKDDYIVLEIQFTIAGVAHYTVASAGQAYGFVSMLYKKYINEPKDQGKWHFCDDLCWQIEDVQGNVLGQSFVRQS